MKELRKREFANGVVYALSTPDGYPVEVTDTFLPFYTKDAIGRKQNLLDDCCLGDRSERWLLGVSCMSGCPVGCKFCATGKLNGWRNLTSYEMVSQVKFILDKQNAENIYPPDPTKAKEFKINWTRMGEPFLNLENVRFAMQAITGTIPNTHHYISTVGIRGSVFSWIEGNTTLQISLHSLDEDRRKELIPINNLMTIEELGQIRTRSNQKTTVNLTLVDEKDFDIEKLKKYFDPKYFFIKLSPVNESDITRKNNIGPGIIKGNNLV